MDVTVFFAWQADRPARVTRNLIRAAAKIACERLASDYAGENSFAIEEATEGVPGMCDIPNVILEKISNSHVFLADLTFVAQTDQRAGEAKLSANPNVLFELGYAASKIGFERILAVMNTAYGEPDSQMFDVKRRWALRFRLQEDSDGADGTAAKVSLANAIGDAIKIIVDKALPKTRPNDPGVRISEVRSQFEGELRQGSFANIESSPSMLGVCLVSDVPIRIEYSRLQNAVLQPLCLANGWDHTYTGNSVIWFRDQIDDAGRRQNYCVTEATTDGCVFAANANILERRSEKLRSATSKFISSSSLEETIVAWLFHAAPVLTSLNLRLPWRVCISLLGVKGHHFLAGTDQMSRITYGKNDLILSPVCIESGEQISTVQSVANVLRPTFDFLWREFGYPRALSYAPNGDWQSRW